MFDAGGKIGPEIPGAIEDVDYLLQNILDPNAMIGEDYQLNSITLKTAASSPASSQPPTPQPYRQNHRPSPPPSSAAT